MKVRGIRGAISIEEDTSEEISNASQKLLTEIISKNSLYIDDICSIIFTVTDDITAKFPAAAVRELGYQYIPMLCLTEMSVPGSLQKIIRILIHVNTSKEINEINHIYLKRAQYLRPDIAQKDS